jgi:DNA-binding NarL/FixJ family response regulator
VASITCLFVDDQPAHSTQVTKNIRAHWSLKFGADITFVPKVTVEEGFEELAQRRQAYQIVIADILFPALEGKQKKPRGLELISEAARHRNAMVIVGLSAGDLNSAPDLARRAIDLGADRFFYKGELEDGGGFERLCDDIHNLQILNYLMINNSPSWQR